MNYTKKPVTIQAWKLNLKDPKNIIQMYELVNNVDVSTLQMVAESHIQGEIRRHGGLPIKTLEGKMIASDGDYIIRGVNGEFYPCKSDIFEKTYMPDPNIEDYINRIRDLANNRDVEGTHIEADKILCEVLKTLGQSELVEEFEKLEKWYA
ncbi:hypothetical protein [Haemophilus haemolyticus]|uniref:hypothetical protein n=1 Tax=Haemophilus haemolyticus TaxID=726 RepID=UPI001962A970|nr:hypothetical protein [Haemophilus haemolyticus]